MPYIYYFQDIGKMPAGGDSIIPNFFDLSPLHTAPLERETEKSTFTIDIPLRWSGRVEKQDELC